MSSIIKFDKIKLEGLFEEVSFDIDRGSFHILIGPNGVGKTTLLNIVFGLSLPTSGKISVEGIPAEKPDAKRHMGYMPAIKMWPSLYTVMRLLVNSAYLSGFSMKDAKKEADATLEEHGLMHLKHKHLNKLSLGQQRLVLLLQAIINKPRILILDEPTSNLDVVNENKIFNLIKRLHSEGTTIIMVTHRLELVAEAATDVTFLLDKGVTYTGPTEGLTSGKTLRERMVEYIGGEDA